MCFQWLSEGCSADCKILWSFMQLWIVWPIQHWIIVHFCHDLVSSVVARLLCLMLPTDNAKLIWIRWLLSPEPFVIYCIMLKRTLHHYVKFSQWLTEHRSQHENVCGICVGQMFRHLCQSLTLFANCFEHKLNNYHIQMKNLIWQESESGCV